MVNNGSRDQRQELDGSTSSAHGTETKHTGNSPSVVESTMDDNAADALLPLIIVLPQAPHRLQILVSPHEQVHDVRQSIIDYPAAFQYTCFHLEHRGERVNDFVSVSDIHGLAADSEIRLVEDPYTEKEARIHLVRVRDLIGASGGRTDAVQGILPGLSVFETVDSQASERGAVSTEYQFPSIPDYNILLPRPAQTAPKTIKSISLSPWNPPPPQLRQKGHLLYLIVTTNEGEQHQITAHVGGFFVNKSSNSKFDPFPRPGPKGQAAHSLLTLIGLLSPTFDASFSALQEYNNQKDPLALFQITHTNPASPWLVPTAGSALDTHVADVTRSQETYLIAGMDNTDSLRDWNEEFQSARELPSGTVPDRLFRERLICKLFADFNDAATRGAALVAREEITPLNPTECRDAQIFIYNNIFFSFGADGAGTFTSEGGDEAARVATGKDVAGIKMVFQLDIDQLYAPATAIVDYLGRRIVAQSIVPGLFKQREPGEHQIHYGAVEGKDVVAWDERFEPVFEKFSQACKVKRHPVWDKTGKRFDLQASVETKGLLGTDGRKYILDLYRLTPLDILWLEDGEPETKMTASDTEYPHRMAVLRPELIEAYCRREMKGRIDSESNHPESKPAAQSTNSLTDDSDSIGDHDTIPGNENSKQNLDAREPAPQDVSSGLSGLKQQYLLNPDVFSGQSPQTEDERKELESDEIEVRRVCDYLVGDVIPALLRDLTESDISFPVDGRSLSTLLHKRGINIRYIGQITTSCSGLRLASLRTICVQDMIARTFKHIASAYLRDIPMAMASACISHLLNCLLGVQLNPNPEVDMEAAMRTLYPDANLAFVDVTPETLKAEIESQILRRFRYKLESNWLLQIRPMQLLREVSIKLGLQLRSRRYVFTRNSAQEDTAREMISESTVGTVNGDGKKKKKKAGDESHAVLPSSMRSSTFKAEDIVNLVPVVKTSSSRSSLPEEALEAGRISIIQGQRKLGQELLLESLSLHEQVYGLIHPEVARAYGALSMLYYQLDEKSAAVELARKAIIVAERTIGIDSYETLLDYLNLGLFLHQVGESVRAMAFVKHALELWTIIYGPNHPDSITTINNGAVMLQSLKGYHESRRWFEQSLRICETVFGKQSLNAATLLFQLAQALALDQDSKAAVNRMRESYNIFLNELGPADKNTREAESWLEQLTQNAVSIAKHAKDSQARRLREGIKFAPRVAPLEAAEATQKTGDSRASQGKVDMRSIDELIRFIEGDQQKLKGRKTQPAERNSKARGNTVR